MSLFFGWNTKKIRKSYVYRKDEEESGIKKNGEIEITGKVGQRFGRT